MYDPTLFVQPPFVESQGLESPVHSSTSKFQKCGEKKSLREVQRCHHDYHENDNIHNYYLQIFTHFFFLEAIGDYETT